MTTTIETTSPRTLTAAQKHEVGLALAGRVLGTASLGRDGVLAAMAGRLRRESDELRDAIDAARAARTARDVLSAEVIRRDRERRDAVRALRHLLDAFSIQTASAEAGWRQSARALARAVVAADPSSSSPSGADVGGSIERLLERASAPGVQGWIDDVPSARWFLEHVAACNDRLEPLARRLRRARRDAAAAASDAAAFEARWDRTLRAFIGSLCAWIDGNGWPETIIAAVLAPLLEASASGAPPGSMLPVRSRPVVTESVTPLLGLALDPTLPETAVFETPVEELTAVDIDRWRAPATATASEAA